jgi:pyruvate formate lyase activating enzyme
MKHCLLNCVWCHNPESIPKKPLLEWLKHKCIGCKTCTETCKEKALLFDSKGLHINRERCTSCGECAEECPSTALHMFGTLWTLKDLFHEVNKDKVYYTKSGGGVTISGGEPTLQPEFTKKFLKKCKENEIRTALDTCGYVSKDILNSLLPYVDLILLDIKEIDPEKHKKFTGVSNEKILYNAKWLANYVADNDKRLWIRTPLIPNYTATQENIKGIGKFIVGELENIPERWDLLAFNNLCKDKYERLDMEWKLKEVPLMRKVEIEDLYQIAIQTGVKNVQWSGLTKSENELESVKSKSNNTSLPSC